jgi:uncharacterized membrane protein (UPF0136 family)
MKNLSNFFLAIGVTLIACGLWFQLCNYLFMEGHKYDSATASYVSCSILGMWVLREISSRYFKLK